HPGYEWRAMMAIGFIAISVLTLTCARADQPGAALRTSALIGGVILGGAGIWAIRANVDDGFADVIGAAFGMQAVLTVIAALRGPGTSSSPARSSAASRP